MEDISDKALKSDGSSVALYGRKQARSDKKPKEKCSYCGKLYYKEADCWEKHPEKREEFAKRQSKKDKKDKKSKSSKSGLNSDSSSNTVNLNKSGSLMAVNPKSFSIFNRNH